MNFAVLELFGGARYVKNAFGITISWTCCEAFSAFHCMGILLQAHFAVKHEVLQCRLL